MLAKQGERVQQEIRESIALACFSAGPSAA